MKKNNHKCNFRAKLNYPLNSECLAQFLLCNTISTKSNGRFIYYGTSEGKFTRRCNDRKKLFRHHDCMNSRELLELSWIFETVWDLNNNGFDQNLSWKIHKKASPYQCGSKSCNLSLLEEWFHYFCWSLHSIKQNS